MARRHGRRYWLKGKDLLTKNTLNRPCQDVRKYDLIATSLINMKLNIEFFLQTISSHRR